MPQSKRVSSIVLRCIPVVVALSFLVFYVGRAQRKQSEMFSSSKNLRALSIAADQYFLEQPSLPMAKPPAAVPPLPPLSPTFPAPSDSAIPAPDTLNDNGQASVAPFRIGIFPRRPTTLSGSKSASRAIVDTSELLSLWSHPPKTSYHHFDLPLLRALPREMTFGDPSIRVHTDDVASPSELTSAPSAPASPESPATSDASSTSPSDPAPEPAPLSSPTIP